MKLFRFGTMCGLAAILAGLPWLAGCGSEKAAPSTNAPGASSSSGSGPKAPAPRAELPVGDADLLQGVPLGASVTNKEMAEADQAWSKLVLGMRPPQQPPEWKDKEPSQEQIAAFQKKIGESAADTASQAREFYTKYPTHEKAREARDREQYLLNVAVQLGHTNAQEQLAKLEVARLSDPTLSEDERLQLRVQQLQRTAFKAHGDDIKAVLEDLEKGARALQKEFPKRPEIAGLLLGVAEGWLDRDNVEKARKLATEVVDGAADDELKGTAQALLKKISRLGKPVEIKFAAVDGRAVDLQAMKGKVVLVDFWATWCGPCMQELPNVKAAYEKLNPKGFEIVGISLDQQLAALKTVVEQQKLPWPQHFDESEDGNKFAQQFEVASIPTMWLIDKKGNLRDINAREDLVTKVEKLLAE